MASSALFVSANSNRCFNPHCPTKDALEQKVKRCTHCFFAVYCNQVCQRADWTRHKPECAEKMKQQVLQECARITDWHLKNESALHQKADSFGWPLSVLSETEASIGMSVSQINKLSHMTTRHIHLLQNAQTQIVQEINELQALLPKIELLKKHSTTINWAREQETVIENSIKELEHNLQVTFYAMDDMSSLKQNLVSQQTS